MRPKLDKNIFGVAVGGAIIKNRAFFFYSYEGERTTQGATNLRTVPLPNLGQGIVRFRNTNGQISTLDCSQITTVFSATSGCNPLALAVFTNAAARYPANSFEIGDGLNTGGFRFNADNKVKNNSHVLRLDFNLNAEQQTFFRFNYISDTGTSAPQFPDTPLPFIWNHPTGFAAGHSWTISKNVFNNFRFGLTRSASSSIGDSSDNAISFTDVFSPVLFQRTFSPIDSVNNLTDDGSWIRRNHTFQFGTNIRLIRSRLSSFARAYDSAATNPASFNGGGNSITSPLNGYLQNAFGYQIQTENLGGVQNAVAAIVGRFSTYSAALTYLRDGSLQPSGTPRKRNFRSREYDFYASDIWKIRRNLTLTAGLRYGLSRPIYEANGYEVKPNIALSEYFRLRANGAANGTPFNEPIVLDYSGRANGRTSLYKPDKNNLQPRIALAWSPDFGKSLLGRLFGRNNESVIRGGFSVINDYLSVIIAGRFDNQNALGFASNSQVSNRTYLPANLAPSFNGFNQTIRNLPNPQIPVGVLTFPRQAAIQNKPTAVEFSLDENMSAPNHYIWSLTYERTLPKNLLVSVSYLGRRARNLLQPCDAAAIADFIDTQSDTDWNAAATQLEISRQQGAAVSQISQIPYFANLFPSNLSALLGCSADYNQTQAVYSLVFKGAGGCGNGANWTNVQRNLSRLSSRFPGHHIFYLPQYVSYRAWSSIGKSDYQAVSFSVRQRLGTRLTLDFNYTFSRTKDDGSGLQTALTNPAAAIINPFRQ